MFFHTMICVHITVASYYCTCISVVSTVTTDVVSTMTTDVVTTDDNQKQTGDDDESSSSNSVAVIVLAVMLGLTVLAIFIAAIALYVKKRLVLMVIVF